MTRDLAQALFMFMILFSGMVLAFCIALILYYIITGAVAFRKRRKLRKSGIANIEGMGNAHGFELQNVPARPRNAALRDERNNKMVAARMPKEQATRQHHQQQQQQKQQDEDKHEPTSVSRASTPQSFDDTARIMSPVEPRELV